MDSAVQCTDLNADRALGKKWETKFCRVAAQFGRSFTAHQIGREYSAKAISHNGKKYYPSTLPDITIWTAPGEHHEVKHKDQTSNLEFGLEQYRLDALIWFRRETQQRVFYTIHDYGKQPFTTRGERKNSDVNDPLHWVTCDVEEMAQTITRTKLGQSWVNGRPQEVLIHYWRAFKFRPLSGNWGNISEPDLFGRNESRREDSANA